MKNRRKQRFSQRNRLQKLQQAQIYAIIVQFQAKIRDFHEFLKDRAQTQESAVADAIIIEIKLDFLEKTRVLADFPQKFWETRVCHLVPIEIQAQPLQILQFFEEIRQDFAAIVANSAVREGKSQEFQRREVLKPLKKREKLRKTQGIPIEDEL